MNKNKYGLLMFTLMFLVACGGGSSTTQEKNDNVSDLIGTWEKTCSGDAGVYFVTRFSHSITGKLVVELRFHSDSNCATSNGIVTFQEYTFSTGDEITTTGGVTARKIEFNLVKTVKNGVIQNNQLGTLFDIYLVQNSMYYHGLNNGILQEENRPTQLDFNSGATKISGGVIDMPAGTVLSSTENGSSEGDQIDDSNNSPGVVTGDFGELNFTGSDIAFVGSSFSPTFSSASQNNISFVWSESTATVSYGESSLLSMSIVNGSVSFISFVESQVLTAQPAKTYSWLTLCFLEASSCENAVVSFESKTIKFANFPLFVATSFSENLAESTLLLNGTLTWETP